MSTGRDFEENEREREVRRKVFYLTFAALALIFGGFLIWKLSILILPIIVVILVVIPHVPDDVVFQPFVLGGAVNFHPLMVVVAIIAGSLIMGLWGMLFAIPTLVVVKTAVATLFKELKDYRII
jgi:putative heme transporter